MSGSNIKVACRFRPQNRVELENEGKVVIEIVDEQTCIIEHSKGKSNFSFDSIFGWDSTQLQVYAFAAQPVVNDVMNGYNGTIFAYGQTGSGKTFTMQGPDIDNSQLKGIIPRIVDNIFDSIVKAPSNIEFTVSISYLEIYLEKIRDLLDIKNDNLQIHEDKIKGIYVKGLRSVYVSSPEETLEVMRVGTESRAVSATNMNEESSRSHSVMLLTITQKNTKDGASKAGKLYLVDLAGSEVVSKTGASGQTLEEAKKINRSLTSLGMVINALTDGKSTHIPYRDSKLTRLLQESLGGNSRTSLIINCSPSSYNELETLSTLRFGMRAKKIENKAKINQELSVSELKKLLDLAKKELLHLHKLVKAMDAELSIWRSGGKVNESDYVIASKLLDEGDVKKEQKEEKKEKQVIEKTEISEDVSMSHSASLQTLSRSSSFSSSVDDESSTPEGDLIDQLMEKEVELKNQQTLVEKLQEELHSIRNNQQQLDTVAKENKDLKQKLNDLMIKYEKQTHDNLEANFSIESLQYLNQSLQEEVKHYKQKFEEMEELSRKQEDNIRSEKVKAKFKEEMASVNTFNDEITAKENEMRATLERLSTLENGSQPQKESPIISEIEDTKSQSSKVATLEKSLQSTKHENFQLQSKLSELESKCSSLERENENLLDELIAREEESQLTTDSVAETLHDYKAKLENQYQVKREQHIKDIEDVKLELIKKNDEIEKFKNIIVDQKWQIEQLQTNQQSLQSIAEEQEIKTRELLASTVTVDEKDRELASLKKMMNRQIEDFNKMKEYLMKDLQNRCQKVVELEISLDEARDKYQSVQRSLSSKSQQKKMQLLEKNLEQVTAVHKQLVEQNSNLKREAAMTSRKLEARAERIHALEVLVQDSQERLERLQQKNDAEIQALQEKNFALQKEKEPHAARYAFDGRIAKPIRGGAQVNSPMTSNSSTNFVNNPGTPTQNVNTVNSSNLSSTPQKLIKSDSQQQLNTNSPNQPKSLFGFFKK